MAPYRGRLAPSPTGALHLGNARTFLVAWLRARQAGGKLILRVEDIDGPRIKPRAAAESLADLRWLGLDWDEGPDLGGPHAPYVQTERRGLYARALARLEEHALVYPCICTRKEVEEAASAPHASPAEVAGGAPPSAPDGARYPGTCRARFPRGAVEAEASAGRAPAWRFRVAPGPVRFRDVLAGERAYDVEATAGDFVVAKADPRPPADRGAEPFIEPAYQLAVVVDDAAMGVTEVVRGDDLLPSTARQLLLYEALGAPRDARDARAPAFLHLPLVVGPDGRRLAKRHGDTTIAAYRRAGVPAERIVGLLARWLGIEGLGAEARTGDLTGRFELERIPRGPLVFDPATAPLRSP